MSQIAIHGQIFPSQLLDDLVLALDVLREVLVLLLDVLFLLEQLLQLAVNDLLLLLHRIVSFVHFLCKLSVLLLTEVKLLLELKSITRAGFQTGV